MVINLEVHSVAIKCLLLGNYEGTKGSLFAALGQGVLWSRVKDAQRGLLNTGVPKSSQSTNVSQISPAQRTSSALFKNLDQKGGLLEMMKDQTERTDHCSQDENVFSKGFYREGASHVLCEGFPLCPHWETLNCVGSFLLLLPWVPLSSTGPGQ